MKGTRVILVVAGVVAAVVIGSMVADEQTPAPVVVSPKADTPRVVEEETDPVASAEQEYLDNFFMSDVETNEFFSYATDDELLAMGWEMCTIMNEWTLEEFIVEAVTDPELAVVADNAQAVGHLSAAAGIFLCPEHEGWAS